MSDELNSLSPADQHSLEAAMSDMDVCETVADVYEKLEKTERGNPVQARTNCSYIPLLKDAFRYNLLSNRVDVVKPLGWKRSGDSTLKDDDIKRVLEYVEEKYKQKNDVNDTI